jgi:hypothetical protein
MSQSPKKPIRLPPKPRPERPQQKDRPERPPVDFAALPKSQPSNGDFMTKLTECESTIKNTKCVVFRITNNKVCSLCRSPDFIAASNKLKESLANNPDVKYYDFDWAENSGLVGMLEIIEQKVPYFKIFADGKLVKTYSGTKHMAEIEKDVQAYTA